MKCTTQPQTFEYYVPYNIRVIRNDSTNNIQFQLVDPDQSGGLVNGSILMQIRDCTTGAVLKELSSANGGIEVVNEVDGLFSVKPYVCDLSPKKYSYDIQITYADGSVKTRFKGIYEVLKDISQL